MRPGSGDDPFAEEDGEDEGEDRDGVEDVEQEELDGRPDAGDVGTDRANRTTGGSGEGDQKPDTGTDSDSSPTSRLPYIYRRDRVLEERSGVTVYLRDETQNAEDKVVDELEEILGEDVHVSDVREAALEAAFRNPELIAEVLREYGYDFK